jgi:hypothetical protein
VSNLTYVIPSGGVETTDFVELVKGYNEGMERRERRERMCVIMNWDTGERDEICYISKI